jgi:hypothetical protein
MEKVNQQEDHRTCYTPYINCTKMISILNQHSFRKQTVENFLSSFWKVERFVAKNNTKHIFHRNSICRKILIESLVT